MRLGLLQSRDRGRVAELLHATAAFTEAEISVALELFDIAHTTSSSHVVEGWQTAGVNTAAIAVAVDYEFIGAFDDTGVLLGYACFGPMPVADGTYDLYWLAVDPAAQGLGIGKALVASIEQELVGRGARVLVVETSSVAKYARTRTFYARLGFVEAARVMHFYAQADDRIILTRRIATRDPGVSTR